MTVLTNVAVLHAAPRRIHPAEHAPIIKAGTAGMFTEIELEDAAAQYKPLVLFEIVSKKEQDFDTRSAKTVYQIRVLASSKAKWTEKDSVWEWGGGLPDSGLHLAIIGVGRVVSKSHHFSPDSMEEAKKAFNVCNSKLIEIKSKFLSLGSMRLAVDGKAEIVLMKVMPITSGDRGEIASIEILKNLSNGKSGQVSMKLGKGVHLEEGCMYLAVLEKSFFGMKLAEAMKTSKEESEPVSGLHSSRLYFLKEPWSKKYAEP